MQHAPYAAHNCSSARFLACIRYTELTCLKCCSQRMAENGADESDDSDGEPSAKDVDSFRFRVLDLEANDIELLNTMDQALQRISALETAKPAGNNKDDESNALIDQARVATISLWLACITTATSTGPHRISGSCAVLWAVLPSRLCDV